MTYGCQTWSLNKQLINREPLKEQWKGKSRVQDKIPRSEMRKRTKNIDIIEYTVK